MDKFTETPAPVMSMAMHAVCTLLGGLFAFFTLYLFYQLFKHFSWGLFFGAITSFFFAEEFLRGAFSRRYPVWLVTLLA
jgi:hypothetical protein